MNSFPDTEETEAARTSANVPQLLTAHITAAQAYPALERAVAAAEERVILLFRVFDTQTKLRTDEAKDVVAAAGGEVAESGADWADLIAAVAFRGVRVRFQISDFDPIGGSTLHAEAWRSLRRLSSAVGALRDDLPVEGMAARHPAELGAFWRRVFAPRARRERHKVTAQTEGQPENEMPALRTVTSGGQPRLFPVTHHQKIAAVDGAFALIGGLDVDERRWDDPDHQLPASRTWRDVSIAAKGPIAREIESVAADIWSECAADWARRTDIGEGVDALRRPEPWSHSSPTKGAATRVLTTRSVAKPSVFAFAPRKKKTEILDEILAMIRGAKRFIYIETQFLRHRPVAEALADAARRNPSLEMVAILPFAPERYAFEGRRDTAMAHAEALQLNALKLIIDAFGVRCAILSPAKPHRQSDDDRFVAFGAGIVYLHSKVFLVDGRRGLIGSANLNGRSLLWDTEAALAFESEEFAGQMLTALAESWGVGAASSPEGVAPWADCARENAAKTPEERNGFLLPHDLKRAGSFARRAFWLPDALF